MKSQDIKAKAIIGLSPMDGITDAAFRHVVKQIGNPDIMFSEFTSAEGISKSAEKLLIDLLFDESHRPIIAQLFGYWPEAFRIAAIVMCELGFDGIDINMGCPAKSVAQKGGGATLIQHPELAKDIIKAVKFGVRDWVNGIELQSLELSKELIEGISAKKALLPEKFHERKAVPVSVKTRTGYEKHNTKEWISHLLEEQPAAIAIHARTYKQMYCGEADWEQIGLAAELAKGTKTKIYGNGDIKTYKQALERINSYKLGGVLIGRAAMGNPWVFNNRETPVTWEERKAAIQKHITAHKFFYQGQHFLSLRKHLGWYVKEIPNASELRQLLYRTNTYQEVEHILASFT